MTRTKVTKNPELASHKRTRRKTSAIRRARGEDEREARSLSILAAAEELFLEHKEQLPTVAEVARRTGIAKGTIYLYFPTKETLFLALFELRAGEWIADIERQLSADTVPATADWLIEVILSYPMHNTGVLDLASLSSTMLETNIAIETTMAFKAALGRKLARCGATLAGRCDSIDGAPAAMLFIRSYAYLVGIWQLVELPTALKEAREKSDIPLFAVTFEQHAREGLRPLWSLVLPGDTS